MARSLSETSSFIELQIVFDYQVLRELGWTASDGTWNILVSTSITNDGLMVTDSILINLVWDKSHGSFNYRY